ncbi:siphovirus ReqiPepy6 Gp37-like family protein [Viridibacillus arvi]|uniref:siphovirus ReqiPepy6 Gp37-like family protein n=1 Tax=Viridibacillus arvi TaxID=263475 RepID=UPI0034CF4C5A
MLYVCDENFNRLGMVGSFSYLLWRKKYGPCGEAELHVDVTMKNIDLLKKGNILFRQDDNEAMYIYYRGFSDDNGIDQLVVKCYSLLKWTDRRILWGIYNFSETVESAIRRMITENLINPSLAARRIPQVQLTGMKNITGPITKQISYDEVYSSIDDLCNTYDLGIRCLFDGRKLEYDLYQGADRTINQMENPRIILSKSRANLLKRTYEDADNDFKNTALIAGAGEGTERKTATIESGTGLARRELFVDARELSDTVDNQDGEGEPIKIPEAQYKQLLIAKGTEKLAEYDEFISFDCELDVTKENTKYNEDFFLGDLVTIKDEQLDILMNSRVLEADEVFQKDGKSIFVKVGKSVPTLPQALKRMVK